ncbi:hypothetical protein NMY22_g7336 [Coprinellus aureogranulatus]|nr:hypothetical protein NMY22_g7336 [Coprinellus aureogranulatus]
MLGVDGQQEANTCPVCCSGTADVRRLHCPTHDNLASTTPPPAPDYSTPGVYERITWALPATMPWMRQFRRRVKSLFTKPTDAPADGKDYHTRNQNGTSGIALIPTPNADIPNSSTPSPALVHAAPSPLLTFNPLISPPPPSSRNQLQVPQLTPAATLGKSTMAFD